MKSDQDAKGVPASKDIPHKTGGVIYGDPDGPSFGPARDGGIWVRSERCSTCIFHPGNLMHLQPGVVGEMKRSADERGTCIICHDGMHGARAAVCRGYYDNHQSELLTLAERMGIIHEESNLDEGVSK